MNQNLQYLTDDSGKKTAVVVPYNKWLAINKENKRLKQLVIIKNGLKDAFLEFEEIKAGKGEMITLSEFLDER